MTSLRVPPAPISNMTPQTGVSCQLATSTFHVMTHRIPKNLIYLKYVSVSVIELRDQHADLAAALAWVRSQFGLADDLNPRCALNSRPLLFELLDVE